MKLNILRVDLLLETKHIYEILYNRINSDLLLWEPSAPKQKIPSAPVFSSNFNNYAHENQDLFRMCKSGVQYGNTFFYCYDYKFKRFRTVLCKFMSLLGAEICMKLFGAIKIPLMYKNVIHY